MCTVFTIPALAACLLTAPAPCDHVKGEGAVVKKQLTVDAFHGIQVEGSMNVVLTQSATRSVEVEAQANLVDLVTTVVQNGVWIIETSKGYSTNKAFTVHISAPLIDIVHVNGSGDVSSEGTFTAGNVALTIQGSGDIGFNCEAKNVRVDIGGSGDVKLSGSSTTLRATIEGSGDVMANDLKTGDAVVEVQGSGDVKVAASQSLIAEVQGSGDVVYSGQPAHVSRNVQGSGEVRPASGGHGPL